MKKRILKICLVIVIVVLLFCVGTIAFVLIGGDSAWNATTKFVSESDASTEISTEAE